MEQEVIKDELVDCHLFVKKSNSRFLILEDSLRHVVEDALDLIDEAI